MNITIVYSHNTRQFVNQHIFNSHSTYVHVSSIWFMSSLTWRKYQRWYFRHVKEDINHILETWTYVLWELKMCWLTNCLVLWEYTIVIFTTLLSLSYLTPLDIISSAARGSGNILTHIKLDQWWYTSRWANLCTGNYSEWLGKLY